MKKFFIILASILGLLLVAAIVLPIVYKGKLVSLLQKEINNNVNAQVSFDEDISLSLIKNFPNFTLGISKLSVVGIHEFEGDTLFATTDLSCTVDVMSVIKGDAIGIRKVYLKEPRVHALVLSNGKANWDIAKPSTDTTQTTDTTQSNFHVQLKSLVIEDGTIVYDDKVMGVHTALAGFNYEMSGDFTQDEFGLAIQSTIKEFSMNYGGVKYLNKVNTAIKMDLDMNMPQMKFTFKENSFALNELTFNFDGFVQMLNEDIVMDLKYDAPNSSFKNFLSLVPGIYTKDFADLKTSGSLGFNGTAKGTYNEKSLPAFQFNLNIADAMFQYPTLPLPVKDVQVKLQVSNPDGNLNNTKVDLSKFHMDVAGDAFDAKLIVTNVMQDPNIDSWLKGKVNLGNVSKILPLENGMQIGGLITSDITAKGRVSAIEQQKFEEFYATGQFVAQNISFTSKDLPKGFQLSEANMSFSPKTVALNSFDAKMGQSDFKLKGEVSNFFPYLFHNGILEGKLSLNSTMINANEFITQEETPAKPAAADTTSMVAPEIPNNINFSFSSAIDKLVYSNMDITNFTGLVTVQNQKLAFSNVGLNTLGAAVKMNGFYETTNPIKPTTQMNFAIREMDMQLAAKTFNTIKKLAPAIEKAYGKFSTELMLNTTLDNHLNPIYPSLFAQGNLAIANGEIKDIRVLDELAKALHNEKYKSLSLKDVRIDFKVENGRIYTQPFNVTVAGKSLQLSGSSGLDQSIDYKGTTNVNKSELGQINTALESALTKLNSKTGASIKTSETVALGIGIGGTFTKPVITTNLADLAKQEANNLKDQAKEELERQKKLLEEKANAEKERLKAEALAKKQELENKAKEEAEKAKQKAQAELDNAKKEAEAKAAAEKERLKKQAEEEAKKKLKGLLKP